MNNKVNTIISRIADNFDEVGHYVFPTPIEFGEYTIVSVCNNIRWAHGRKMVTWNPDKESISVCMKKDGSVVWLYGGSKYQEAIEKIYKSF